MAHVNPLVGFLAAYGPSAASDNLYDEHVASAAERCGVDQISVDTKLPEKLQEILNGNSGQPPKSVILTGTAGDGKTWTARKLFELLEGDNNRERWGLGSIVDSTLPSGRRLRIVKDLSELDDTRKRQELIGFARSTLTDEGTSYLIAANDGQLLAFFREIESQDETEATSDLRGTIAIMLKDDLEGPSGRRDFVMFNMSRRFDGEMFDELLAAVTEHKDWRLCDGCPASAEPSCPIRINRALLAGPRSVFRQRLKDVLRLLAANEMHLPIRQVLLLTVNALLGDKGRDGKPGGLLTCAKAKNRAKEGGYGRTNPFDLVAGLNLGPQQRKQYRAFAAIEQLGLGRETNNAFDDLILDRESADDGAADPYGPDLFEPARKLYRGQDDEAFDYAADVAPGLESQRRRRFFLDSERADDLNPWRLTVFGHGGEYLALQDLLGEQQRRGRPLDPPVAVRRSLLRGMNRSFTGLMCAEGDELFLATSLSGAAGGGRVLVCDPIKAGRSTNRLRLAFGLDAQRRPVLKILLDAEEEPLASLTLKPLLFEYLMRVADGSLPSSFSRQCSEELRHFRLGAEAALGRNGLTDAHGFEGVQVLSMAGGKLRAEPLGVAEAWEDAR